MIYELNSTDLAVGDRWFWRGMTGQDVEKNTVFETSGFDLKGGVQFRVLIDGEFSHLGSMPHTEFLCFIEQQALLDVDSPIARMQMGES